MKERAVCWVATIFLVVEILKGATSTDCEKITPVNGKLPEYAGENSEFD